MASDIKIFWDPTMNEGDFQIINGDIALDNGLASAVIISLFTDRQAKEDDPYDNNDRRGWWGDQIDSIIGNQIGSRLWLVDRAKATTENINLAKGYIKEALQWMVDDGIAVKVEAIVQRAGRPGNDRLYFGAMIYKSDGTTTTYKFDKLWAAEYANN